MDTKRINSGYKGKIRFGHEENQISYIRFCSVFIDVKALMFVLVPVSTLLARNRVVLSLSHFTGQQRLSKLHIVKKCAKGKY